ncbi:MAG: hypothetical protein IT531_00520 [Burkholderiales bacterium]|nr:hypothetical protein [Burkholderiales bacterium]
MARTFVARIGAKGVAVFRSARDLTAREKRHLLNEILQVRGLMPLLMKQRNKGRWTIEDRAELRVHLRRLSSLSPYLVVLALPGSFIMLPALAWWLDRRRTRNRRLAQVGPKG